MRLLSETGGTINVRVADAAWESSSTPPSAIPSTVKVTAATGVGTARGAECALSEPLLDQINHHLPRQARDKHKKMLRKAASSAGEWSLTLGKNESVVLYLGAKAPELTIAPLAGNASEYNWCKQPASSMPFLRPCVCCVPTRRVVGGSLLCVRSFVRSLCVACVWNSNLLHRSDWLLFSSRGSLVLHCRGLHAGDATAALETAMLSCESS